MMKFSVMIGGYSLSVEGSEAVVLAEINRFYLMVAASIEGLRVLAAAQQELAAAQRKLTDLPTSTTSH
jgi:hypothetical protein